MVQEKKDIAYGKWNLPTGKIEEDESSMECAAREAKEEAGVDANPESLVGFYKKPGEKSEVVLAIIFESTIDDTNLFPNKKEVMEARWIPLGELTNYELRSSHIMKSIEDYMEGKRYPLNSIRNLEEV